MASAKKDGNRKTDGAQTGKTRPTAPVEDLLSAVPYPFFMLDPDGNISWFNQAVPDLFRCKSDELGGQSAERFFDSPARFRAVLNETLRTGSLLRVELDARAGNGRTIPLSVAGRRLRTGSGADRGSVWLLRDLTELREIDQALAESQEKYRNVVERINDGIVIIQDGLVRYVNPRMGEITGLPVEGTIGNPFTDYLVPEALPEVAERYQRRMAGEVVPERYETVLKSVDGGSVPVEVYARRMTYQGLPADLVVVRDITERRKVEADLRESEARYRQLFEATPIGTVIAGYDGKVLAANQRMLGFTGYALAELQEIGTPGLYVNPEERARIVETLRREGRVHELEVELRRKDGVILDIVINVQVMELAGEPVLHCTVRDITERKRAEAALQASEARYRLLFELAPCGIILADGDRRILAVNQYVCDLSGYTLDELRRARPEEFGIDADLPKRLGMFLRREGRVVDFEMQLRRRDGVVRTVLLNLAATEIDGDKRFFVTAIDITDRKGLERQLAHLNGVLWAIRNAGQIIAREADRERLLSGVCENLLEARGYRCAWAALLDDTRKVNCVVHAGVPDARELRRRMQAGDLPAGAGQALDQNRLVLTDEVLTSTARFGPGRSMYVGLGRGPRVYGVLAVEVTASTPVGTGEQNLLTELGGDIGDALHLLEVEEERRRAVSALAASEQRFQQVADNAQEWIWEVDADGRYTYCSPVVEKILGYRPEQLVGVKHYYDLFRPGDRQHLRAIGQALFAARRPFRETVNCYVHREGRDVWVLSSGVPVLDETGQFAGYRGADTDITRRKQAEDEIREKTEQLVTANTELQRLSEVKSKFVANVSHDLRTPLTTITEGVALVEDGTLGPVSAEQRKFLQLAQDDAERLTRLIADLLDMARVEQGKLTARPAMVDAGAAVERILGQSERQFQERQLTLLKEPPAQDLRVWCDPGHFERIFTNLLSNALKYTPAGGRVTVRVERCPGRMVRVLVRDTGIGIPADQQYRLFRRFEQICQSGGSVVAGIGIGLSLCKEMAELNHGTIGFESTEHVGSTFYFTLPESRV